MWFYASSHQYVVSVSQMCVCVIACVCLFEGDRECVYLCTSKPQTVHTHKLLCVWALNCNPACVYVDQNHMRHFCTKTMINATFLSSQWGGSPCYWAVMCLFFPPCSFVRSMSRVKPHRVSDQHESLRHTRVLRLWWTSALSLVL